MKNTTKFKLATALMVIIATTNTQAVEIENNGYTFGFSGYVNTHAVFVSCDDNPDTVAENALLCAGDDATSVSNGYSPSSFQFSAATEKTESIKKQSLHMNLEILTTLPLTVVVTTKPIALSLLLVTMRLAHSEQVETMVYSVSTLCFKIYR